MCTIQNIVQWQREVGIIYYGRTIDKKPELIFVFFTPSVTAKVSEASSRKKMLESSEMSGGLRNVGRLGQAARLQVMIWRFLL